MKLRFDSVFYYVRDLDRAVRFYTEVLQLPLGSRDLVARLDVDGVMLELVPTTDPARLTGRGNARLCLGVEDVAQAVAHLRSRDVLVHPVQTTPQGLLAAFQDPDGNELALWQHGRV